MICPSYWGFVYCIITNMNNDILKLNYFELFGLLPQYSIDKKALQDKMRQLQQQYHPDNAVSDDNLNALAIKLSSYVNQAYNSLLDPLERAIYLLRLNNIQIDLIRDTKFSHEFLIKQIEIRENISDAQEAQDIDMLEEIEQSLKSEYIELELQITQKFEVVDYLNIIEDIKKLSFYSKLLKLVNDILCEI